MLCDVVVIASEPWSVWFYDHRSYSEAPYRDGKRLKVVSVLFCKLFSSLAAVMIDNKKFIEIKNARCIFIQPSNVPNMSN